jgi:hypothetical protein
MKENVQLKHLKLSDLRRNAKRFRFKVCVRLPHAAACMPTPGFKAHLTPCPASLQRFLCFAMCVMGPLAVAQTSNQAPPTGQRTANPADENDLGTGYPRLDDPWTLNKQPTKNAKESSKEPTREAPVATPASQTPAPEAAAPVPATEGTADLQPKRPKTRNNEVSVSGDFLLGKGNVTMPFGFSLVQVPGLGNNITPNVAKPDRSSDYYGGTLSYSYGQAFYLDLAYAHGNSSGNAPVTLGQSDPLNSSFNIKDDRYQAYLRYTFPGLRGKRFSAYLRAGVSYVKADLTDDTVFPALGLYHQSDKTDDLLGNFGFGLGFTLHTWGHLKLGLQAEGEGFYGRRQQTSLELLPQAGPGFEFVSAKINNDLYGGIGRGTVRVEYRFGSTGALKIFGDGGLQGEFTEIKYKHTGSFPGGTFSELLWGPYIKVGLRYSF